MTGLDLESFLRLLRADLTAWFFIGPVLLAIGLLVWSCRGSRRALRKCLVLSLTVHFGLVLYGSTIPAVRSAFGAKARPADEKPHLRQVRVTPRIEANRPGQPNPTATTLPESNGPRLDLMATSSFPDALLQVPRPKASKLPELATQVPAAASLDPPAVVPSRTRDLPAAAIPEERADDALTRNDQPNAPAPPLPLAADLEQKSANANASASNGANKAEQGVANAAARPDIALRSDRRLRPRPSPGREQTAGATTAPARASGIDRSNTAIGPTSGAPATTSDAKPRGTNVDPADKQKPEPVALARATPSVRSSSTDRLAPLGLGDLPTGRAASPVPRVYQSRIEPDRSLRARRSGASVESELAVERALDWLTRHQDAEDGRWDAGVARYDDGSPVKGDDDYTKHCPPGETCFGECAYWEADTALTGLALLTYLGAGYTHTRGHYTEPVSKGLDFLLSQQKPDGDLRGESTVVGMYCHAMATLALCEAYALTGDRKLREPTERAIAFLVRARARDGLAWRYAPGAPVGDTSILGWVVMGLESARKTQIAIPKDDSVRRGTLDWLDKVATGTSKGLARYQPWDPVTPTMTAEAWVCRQFMGVGGPGKSSSEAAEFLLRNPSDRGKTNVYYWYYATLALYQHGGEPWLQWNAKVRDRVVNLQQRVGHQSGSWDPDESLYGSKGGRIYCTTLAALTLEVYYRYLRLYDAPTIPTEPLEPPTNRADDPNERVLPPLRVGNPEDH